MDTSVPPRANAPEAEGINGLIDSVLFYGILSSGVLVVALGFLHSLTH